MIIISFLICYKLIVSIVSSYHLCLFLQQKINRFFQTNVIVVNCNGSQTVFIRLNIIQLLFLVIQELNFSH